MFVIVIFTVRVMSLSDAGCCVSDYMEPSDNDVRCMNLAPQPVGALFEMAITAIMTITAIMAIIAIIAIIAIMAIIATMAIMEIIEIIEIIAIFSISQVDFSSVDSFTKLVQF